MLTPCASLRCSAAVAPSRSTSLRSGVPARRAVQAAAAGPGKQRQGAAEKFEELPQTLPRASAPAEVPESDFWEGEQFNLLGNLASYFIPVLFAAAVGVGLFASQTYNEGATVFLDAPKSPQDTAKLIPAEQLQQP